jgi:hypothetical protein
MTSLLEEAFAKVSQLPAEEQDALAAILLDEIASEKRWDQAFAHSQEQLAKLGDEALEEFKKGQTLPLDEEKM